MSVEDSDKRGMPEYQKTLRETTTKGARLSGFHHHHDLLDGTRKRGVPQELGFISDT